MPVVASSTSSWVLNMHFGHPLWRGNMWFPQFVHRLPSSVGLPLSMVKMPSATGTVAATVVVIGLLRADPAERT